MGASDELRAGSDNRVWSFVSSVATCPSLRKLFTA